MLDTIIAKVNLNKTVLKMETSLDDIKKTNSHRKDLIDSMQESLDDLRQVQMVMDVLDRKVLSLSGEVYRKDKMVLEFMAENKALLNYKKSN